MNRAPTIGDVLAFKGLNDEYIVKHICVGDNETQITAKAENGNVLEFSVCGHSRDSIGLEQITLRRSKYETESKLRDD